MKNRDRTIKNIIDSRLSHMTVSENLVNKVYSQSNISRKSYKKPLAIALAACLCIAVSIPVMAATIPSFNRLLSFVSPEISQKLQPIGLTSENNGIKMEVVAAMNDDDTAVAYLTFQDLTANRVDKTIDLYDYHITGANMFTSEVIDYNEQTKTATIRMIGNGGKKLDGKKITLRVDSFLSNKHAYNSVKTGINLAAVLNNRKYKTIPMDTNDIMGGGGDLIDEIKAKETMQILKTDELHIALPNIDFAHISNIGMIDGRLHIQTKWKESIDNHGLLYLTDNENINNCIHPSNIYFGTDEEGNAKRGREYIEYIFDIGQTQLEKYSIVGDFVENGKFVKGRWQSTFKLEAVKKSKQANCSINLGNAKINHVSISPLGITVFGTGNEENLEDVEVSVKMNDDSIQIFTGCIQHNENGEFKKKYMPNKLFDMGNIKEISINGKILEFH
jgi:hypothetical protein